MSLIEIKVPDIGDFKEVEVVEVLVKVGDTIAIDQSLATLESDKASMEIPASHAGIVRELKLKVGDKAAEGTTILLLEADNAAAQPLSPAPTASASAPVPTAPVTEVTAAPVPTPTMEPAARPSAPLESEATSNATPAHASPSVRKLARELGVDLSKLTGTGPKGRIQHSDVSSFVKAALTNLAQSSPAADKRDASGLSLLPWPSLDFSKFGPTEAQPLPRVRKISGPNLHRNWVMIPHVTQFDEADVTDLEDFRQECNASNAQMGVKFTLLAFVVRACIAALKKYPEFNASLNASGDGLILKRYYHIGFAADTPNGLVVPVIKDADQKGIAQIAEEMRDLSAAARDGKLKPADMQGASFTISSLGGIGGVGFTPIVNAPEVAILGLSKTAIKPVWDGNQFAPRLILPLALSYDHRVIDGVGGIRFVRYVAEALADLRKVLL